jgi:hypothetical protein
MGWSQMWNDGLDSINMVNNHIGPQLLITKHLVLKHWALSFELVFNFFFDLIWYQLFYPFYFLIRFLHKLKCFFLFYITFFNLEFWFVWLSICINAMIKLIENLYFCKLNLLLRTKIIPLFYWIMTQWT